MAQPSPDRPQATRLDPARQQLFAHVGKRDALARRRQLAQQIVMVGEQRLAIAADPRRRRRTRRANPLHQLDCRRGAYIKAGRCRPRRTAFLNRPDQP